MTEHLSETTVQILTPVFLALLSALGMLLVQLTRLGISMLNARVSQMETHGDIDRNNKNKQVFQRLIDLAQQKVLMLEQTVVEEIKSQVVAGKIPVGDLPAAVAKVKDVAVQTIKRDAFATGLWDDAQKIFKGNEGNLIMWLEDVIESQVCQLPPSGLQTRDDKQPQVSMMVPKYDPTITLRG